MRALARSYCPLTAVYSLDPGQLLRITTTSTITSSNTRIILGQSELGKCSSDLRFNFPFFNPRKGQNSTVSNWYVYGWFIHIILSIYEKVSFTIVPDCN